jgi:predicted phage terminase large subunit-like protein
VSDRPLLVVPKLRPDQSAIVRHPAKTKVIAMGRRWGKTILAGTVALLAASQGAKVAWVVPTYRNGRPLWRWAEAATAQLRKARLVDVNRTERTMDFLPSGGFLGIYSADNDSAIRGDWFHLVIVDEAARIPETTWSEVVQPTLADADGDALLISTPAGKNWFWREWQRGRQQMDREQAAFTAPSSANPNERIQRAAALAHVRVPENVYRQEWLAEFVDAATSVFLEDWWRETETHPSRRFDPTYQGYTNASLARWCSWDTALADTDDAAYSACVVGELTPDYRLFVRYVWRDRVTFPVLLDKITSIAQQWNIDRKLRAVVIESKVSGISAYQTLKETADPWLRKIIWPFQPEGSKEHRAELAAVWCKQGCVWLPEPSPAVPWLFPFEDELLSFPAGETKDMVDSFSQLVLFTSRLLSEGHAARTRALEAA